MDHSKVPPDNWVDEYGNDLYRYAIYIIKDKHLAEDLVQETFVSALNSLKNTSEISSFKNWLLGILKHKIMDHYRKNNYEKKIKIDSEQNESYFEIFFNSYEHWSPKPKIWWNPRHALEEKEFWLALQNCLSQMPTHMADAFKLRVLNDNSTDDVTTEMNVSETNLGVIMYRARLYLRQCLEDNWFQRKKTKS